MADDVDELIKRFQKVRAATDSLPAGDDDVDALIARYGGQQAEPDAEPAPAAPSAPSKNAAVASAIVNPAAVPSAGKAALLEAQQAVSFGMAPTISAGLDKARSVILPGQEPVDFGERRRAYQEEVDAARRAHPFASMGGGVVGAVAQAPLAAAALPARLLALGNAMTPAMRAAIAAAGLGGAQGAGEALSEGKSPGEIAQAAARGEMIGGVVGGGLGRLAGNAPERVAQRAIDNVVTGETNANKRTAAKVIDKTIEATAEEGGEAAQEGIKEGVKQLFSEQPEMAKQLAVTAATNPHRAAHAVNAVIGNLSAETAPVYEAITKHTGGVQVLAMVAKASKLSRDYAAAGNMAAAQAAETFRLSLINHYGQNGTISDQVKLGARAIQNMKNDLATVAFGGMPGAPMSVKAKVNGDLWRVLAEGIEEAGARTPGVDMARLRATNRDISTLIPIRQALEERAAKANTTTLRQRFMQALPAVGGVVGMGGGGVGGGLAGAATGLALPAAARAAGTLGRSADWHLARLMAGAEAGSIPQQWIAEAITAGLPAATVQAIASHAPQRAAAAVGDALNQ